jgi:type II secretory pathway predicted ATPase ExeA
VPAVQVALAAQPPSYGSPTLARAIEESAHHRARLTPLDRRCEPYVLHRLQVAGGAPVPLPRRSELQRLRARRFRWHGLPARAMGNP